MAKYILLSKLDALETVGNLQFSESDKIWVVPVCCMEENVKDCITFEEFFCTEGGAGERYKKTLIAKGADETSISILNYYEVLDDMCIRDIMSSQYIIFTGGRMELGIERLGKLGLDHILQHYSGTIVGVSAGALMLFTEYIITPNYYYKELMVCEGLGYIDGSKLMIDVHYNAADLVQKQALELTSAVRRQPIYAIHQLGYILIQDNDITQCDGVWRCFGAEYI